MNTKLKHKELKKADQTLEACDNTHTECLRAGKYLSQLAESTTVTNNDDLVKTATLLTNLCELADAATDYDDPSLSQEDIVGFVREHLSTVQSIVDEAVDEQALQQMEEQANERWGEFLMLLQVDAGSENASEPVETKALDESEDDTNADDSQIAMMLAAIEPVSQSEPSDDFQPQEQNRQVASELMQDQELLEAYLDDAYGCLESMEQSVLALEKSLSEKEPLQQFCREIHTLKGASASVGLSELASFLHEVESSAEVWLGREDCQEVEIESLLSAVDAVRAQVTDLANPSEYPAADQSESTNQVIDSARKPKEPRFDLTGLPPSSEASIRIRSSNLDRLMDMLAELVVLRNRRENHVTEMNQLNDELSRCAARLQFAEDQPSVPDAKYRGSNTVAEVAKDIHEVSRNLRDLHKPVNVDNQSISQFIRHFRQELMQLRRLPISGLFNRLQRSARDAANAEEKQVQLTVVGENTGLEQEVQEQLYEPLLHLVRNAVSHGIENHDARIAAGKSPVGSITLEAKSNANLLVIEVHDDGGGIDFEAIQRRAIDRGLLSPGQQASKHELSQLIFHPGFSTRDVATEISGRGIGMDIVASTINQMHGRIEVDSNRGTGSTIRLLIPLRSGIEHVMVFRAGGQLFALPMQSVSAARNSKSLKQNLLQLSLAKLLELKADESQQDDNVLILWQTVGLNNDVKTAASSHGKTNEGQNRFALTVDEVIGPEEVVVRSLPSLFKHHPLFCGVTLSGAGESVLLLNSERLVAACLQSSLDSQPQELDQLDESEVRTSALVVDDSLSARKSLVKKLVQFGFQITEVGDGLEALEQLRQQNFDVVFTDLDMPRMGGLELLSEIQTGHYGATKVVVVSSRNEEEFRSRAYDSGVAGYLTKPVSDESLSDLLAELELEFAQSF